MQSTTMAEQVQTLGSRRVRRGFQGSIKREVHVTWKWVEFRDKAAVSSPRRTDHRLRKKRRTCDFSHATSICYRPTLATLSHSLSSIEQRHATSRCSSPYHELRYVGFALPSNFPRNWRRWLGAPIFMIQSARVVISTAARLARGNAVQMRGFIAPTVSRRGIYAISINIALTVVIGADWYGPWSVHCVGWGNLMSLHLWDRVPRDSAVLRSLQRRQLTGRLSDRPHHPQHASSALIHKEQQRGIST